jgi:hypothetical protein
VGGTLRENKDDVCQQRQFRPNERRFAVDLHWPGLKGKGKENYLGNFKADNNCRGSLGRFCLPGVLYYLPDYPA